MALLVCSAACGCKGDTRMPVMLAPGNRVKVERRGLALAVVEKPREQRLDITLANVGTEPVVVFTESGELFAFIHDGVFTIQHVPTLPYEGFACTLAASVTCHMELHREGRLHPGETLTLSADLRDVHARHPAETLAARRIQRNDALRTQKTTRVSADSVLVRVFAPRYQDVMGNRDVYYGKPLTPKDGASVGLDKPEVTAIEAAVALANPITVTYYEPIELPKKK